MKKIALVIAFCFFNHLLFAQKLTQKDCSKLYDLIGAENWKTAFKESCKLLKENENDSSDFKSRILYVNILSAAGLVTEGKMNFKDLQKHIADCSGKKIIIPARPVTIYDGFFNKIRLIENQNHFESFTSVTNQKKLNILSFEKIILKDKIKVDDYDYATVESGGIIQQIETNPDVSISWILRLTLQDGFVKIVN